MLASSGKYSLFLDADGATEITDFDTIYNVVIKHSSHSLHSKFRCKILRLMDLVLLLVHVTTFSTVQKLFVIENGTETFWATSPILLSMLSVVLKCR